MPLTKDDFRRLAREVVANHKILHACVGPHDFGAKPDSLICGGRRACSKCGGSFGVIEAHFYELGVKHAREEAARAK